MSNETSHIHPEQEDHKDPQLSSLPRNIQNIPRILLLFLIVLYQKTFSRAIPANTCRFYPTCSHYGYQAIFKFGVLKGGWMAIQRVFRCNPFNTGDTFDPVK
jgi:uncharacterized protein